MVIFAGKVSGEFPVARPVQVTEDDQKNYVPLMPKGRSVPKAPSQEGTVREHATTIYPSSEDVTTSSGRFSVVGRYLRMHNFGWNDLSNY